MHQPAGAEKHFLGGQIGVPARPVDMHQPVGGDLVGDPVGGPADGIILLVQDAPHQRGDAMK